MAREFVDSFDESANRRSRGRNSLVRIENRWLPAEIRKSWSWVVQHRIVRDTHLVCSELINNNAILLAELTRPTGQLPYGTYRLQPKDFARTFALCASVLNVSRSLNFFNLPKIRRSIAINIGFLYFVTNASRKTEYENLLAIILHSRRMYCFFQNKDRRY